MESIRRTASIRALAPFVDASSAAAAKPEEDEDGDEHSNTHDDTVLMLFLSATRFANFLKLAPEVRASGKFDQLLRQRSARWLQTLPLFASFRDAAADKLAVLGDLFRYVELAQVRVSGWMRVLDPHRDVLFSRFVCRERDTCVLTLNHVFHCVYDVH